MFRHQGKSRTLKHNLQIAVVLSFVAGIVNVTGFLSFTQLTTNVTGHFAQFIYDVANFEMWKGLIFLLFIVSFLLGSFTSGWLIAKFTENKKLNVYLLPTIIESSILISLPILSGVGVLTNDHLIVCFMLFAMGLQNAFVTQISNAVVRTTHLTGLFTDLGIDVAQLLFLKLHPNQIKLKANIKLRIYIILLFFSGGLAGGFLFVEWNMQLNTLLVAGVILLFSLFYDDFRYRIIKTKRRFNQRKNGTMGLK